IKSEEVNELNESSSKTLSCQRELNNPVPKESFCDDLCREQQLLQDETLQLKRRIRRLQVQYIHRNISQQMKVFVSHEQNLNSLSCQRFSFDFSNFIQSYVSDSSQLKELLLKERQSTNDKPSASSFKSEQTPPPPPPPPLSSLS